MMRTYHSEYSPKIALANGSPTQQFSERCGSAVCGLTVRGLIGYTARMSMTYPSSPSDARWDCIYRILPPRSSHVRLRRHSLRSVFDALLYLLRTDRPWRYLPSHFPPWQTVAIISSNFVRRFCRTGLWTRLYRVLRDAERGRVGRDHTRARPSWMRTVHISETLIEVAMIRLLVARLGRQVDDLPNTLSGKLLTRECAGSLRYGRYSMCRKGYDERSAS